MASSPTPRCASAARTAGGAKRCVAPVPSSTTSEVSGRQVGEALGLPIGDQAVRRDDAAAVHAVLADADLGSRVASYQVGARARFERELHSAVRYRRFARSSL